MCMGHGKMNLFKNQEGDVKVIRPPVLGWLEKKLSDKEMDYLWRCIDNRKRSLKGQLVGNIHESSVLVDRGDWFYINTLQPLVDIFIKEFENIGNNFPTSIPHPHYLKNWWVNYQKQNEFNPYHAHTGLYSFVIWMKIPTRYEEQNKNLSAFNSNCPSISSFEFIYANILGGGAGKKYDMNPEMEGTMLFFPARLHHQVYPFYNCDEDRISISGNISFNTSKRI